MYHLMFWQIPQFQRTRGIQWISSLIWFCFDLFFHLRPLLYVSPVSLNILQVIFGIALITENLKYILFFTSSALFPVNFLEERRIAVQKI